jgi:nitroreductase
MKLIRALGHYVDRVLGFLVESLTDMWLHAKYSYYSPGADKDTRLFYRIVIQAHSIEKGLSLQIPRALFGAATIQSTLQLMQRYNPAHSAFPLAMADGALRDYLSFNREIGANGAILDTLANYLDASSACGYAVTGGVKLVEPSLGVRNDSAISFLQSRSSCRMFAAQVIEQPVVSEIIRLAQCAPSQCNRQASKVHVYQDRNTIRQLLSLQSGAGGFADGIDNLLIVTNEISAWGGPQQRNQMYVDGALFAMMLLLAIEAHGYSSVPLNLAVTNGTEAEIKSVAGIPTNERLIVMIAFGISEGVQRKAARSPRRSLQEIAAFH